MSAVFEVATADVDAEMEVGGALGDAGVVEVDVRVQLFVGGLAVSLVCLPGGEALFVAEVLRFG